MNDEANVSQEIRDMRSRVKYLEETYHSHVELLTLLGSLSSFQTSIQDCREPAKILGVTRMHVQRLMAFRATAFAMVDPPNFDFEVKDCEPSADQPLIQKLVNREIKAGTFAWALRQNHAVIIRKTFDGSPVVLHVIATRSRVMGMFIGLLKSVDTKGIDIASNLLSVILLDCAYALENLTLYNQINEYNLNLEQMVKKRTEELVRANEELIKAKQLEAVGILAGGIAHDFNNMLAVILGNVSLTKMQTPADSKAFTRLTVAEDTCHQAKSLTSQLLTFSQGGAPIKRPTMIGHLVQEAGAFALRGSNARCEFRIPDDLALVEVDENQMRHVVMNLVLNAEQAMNRSGIVQVTAENITLKPGHNFPLPNGDYTRFSVTDHGVGIPPENFDRIFAPFFTTKPGKSGFGLAIANSIVNKHGGHIEVESQVGVGSTFSVYLPAHRTRAPASAPSTRPPDQEKKPSQDHMKVLIMDDEKGVRDVLGAMLTHLGHETVFSSDGLEAVDLYKKAKVSERPFDMVFLDLTVPGGVGGKDALRKLMEMDAGVCAIASSGYSNDPVMSDFRAYGFSGALKKPYELTELTKVLNEVLAR
jgi:signal transduction histidine kinase/CheY-like chemotaxis protein